jgi:hypothetical protein
MVGRYPVAGRAGPPVEVDRGVLAGEHRRAGEALVVVVLGVEAVVGRHHVTDPLVVHDRGGAAAVLEVVHPDHVRAAQDHLVHTERGVLHLPQVDHGHVVDVHPDPVVGGPGEPVDAGGEHVRPGPAGHEVVAGDLRRR